jgi:hypothetical protein
MSDKKQVTVRLDGRRAAFVEHQSEFRDTTNAAILRAAIDVAIRQTGYKRFSNLPENASNK